MRDDDAKTAYQALCISFRARQAVHEMKAAAEESVWDWARIQGCDGDGLEDIITEYVDELWREGMTSEQLAEAVQEALNNKYGEK